MILRCLLIRLIPLVLLPALIPAPAAVTQEPAQAGPKHYRLAGIRDVTGSVSPDGRYYAFTNWQTGQLGVKDLSTGESRYIVTPASEGESSYQARFSPDGSRIAYTWFMEDGTELRVVNVDGSGLRTLYRGYGEAHHWSPDGEYVLANVDRGTVLISISDGSLEVLSEWLPSREMRFSPDGRYIACDLPLREDSPDRDIFLLEIDGGQETPLVEGPGIERVLDWTPDGRWLLFDSDRGLPPGAGRRAWLVEVANGGPVGEPFLVEPELVVTRGLGFSREGAYYFSGYCCGGKDTIATPSGLYLAALDPMTEELGAAKMVAGDPGRPVEWSPDGQYLAYAWHQWPFPSTLGIRSVQTGEERRLPLTIRWTRDSFGLRWSPDGRSLLVQGRDLKDQWGIYRVDPTTGTATPIVQSCCVRWPTWSPDGTVVYVSWEGSGDTMRVVSRDLETGDERELQRMPPPAYLSQLATSPDGRWLAFFWSDVSPTSEARGTWALKLLPLGGGEPRDLTPLEVQGRDSVPPQSYRPSLAWAPDSRHIIYAITTAAGRKPSVRLWRIAAEGGEPESLGPAMDEFGLSSFSLDPSGGRIAFTGEAIALLPQIDAADELWVLKNFLPPLDPER